MTTVRTMRFGAELLDVADVPQLLYTVPAGRRALVHSLAVYNQGGVVSSVLVWTGATALPGVALYVGDLAAGESAYRPREDVWNEGDDVWAVAGVGGIVVVRASGSLLVL